MGQGVDQDLRRGWITALRSGRYVQSKRRLRDETGYCCLGVACDVADPDGWKGMEEGFGCYIFGLCSTSGLPGDLEDRLGLPWSVEHKLMRMNDEEGKTFAEIADFLQKEWGFDND